MDFSKFDSDQYNRKDFEFLGPLGRNTMSRVEKVRDINTGQDFALKVFEKSQIDSLEKFEQLLTEKEMLERCDHPGILKIFGNFTDKEYIYFLLEYCQHNDFERFLCRFSSFPFELVRFYTAEITSVLAYLHTSGIVHGNLKPRNILLSKDFHIKITDFRNTKPGPQHRKKVSALLTADYVSPELLDEGESGPTADLWALGCIIYQMLVGSPPFVAATQYAIFDRIRNGVVNFPLSIPPFAADLIQALLLPDPQLRIGVEDIDELTNHIFFQGINLNKVFGMSAPDYSHEMVPEMQLESKVILEEVVKKKSGWLYKKRILKLTQEPSLVYYDPDRKDVKGKIEISPQLKVEIKSKTDFTIVTPKKSYVFKCTVRLAEDWAKALRDTIIKVYES